MKLSEYSIKALSKAVCGDCDFTPYVKGQYLVTYFNKYGFNDVYEQGFPSRWKFTEDKIRQLNGKDAIRSIIEDTVDPRKFFNQDITVEDAVEKLNEFLRYDKYELRKNGNFFKISDLNGSLIHPETSTSISHDFIQEQINKSQKKIIEEDYNGAITNARSLLEAIFIEIIERSERQEVKNDGDIENLWKRVKKIMKLEVDKTTLPDTIFQILSGIDTALKGLAGLSNNAGDRHANKFNTKKHHAKLAVNLAMTISDFLLDSWQYQNGH